MTTNTAQEAQRIESEVLSIIGPLHEETSYWKPSVARHLLNAWRENSEDTRIVVYMVPVIEGKLAKHPKLVSMIPWDREEIVNELAIRILKALPRIDPDGSIFAFITVQAHYGLLDLVTRNKAGSTSQLDEEQVDHTEHVHSECYELADLSRYMHNVSRVASQIAQIAETPSAHARLSVEQRRVIIWIAKRSQLTIRATAPIFKMLLASYLNRTAPAT